MFYHSKKLFLLILLAAFVAPLTTMAQTCPYKGAFGVQWNRILDGASDTVMDGGGQVVVAPDGSVWTGARSYDHTFGPFQGGASVQSGVGNWSDTGNLLFGRMATMDATGTFSNQHYGGSVAVDASGNTYQAGLTKFSFPGATLAGSTDPYVQKRDSSGNLLWTTMYGSERWPSGTGGWDNTQVVATDAAGNAWSAGYARDPLISDTSYTGTGSSPEDYDPFIFKINADGTIANVGIQPHGAGNDRAYGIAVDQGNGNVAIVGYSNGYTTGATALYGANLGGMDGILGIYDSNMTLLGGAQIGGANTDFTSNAKFDSDGNVVVVGYVNGGEATLKHQAYVGKYDTAGNLLWSDTFGSSGALEDRAYGLDIDANGNIYVSGQTQGDLGGTNAGKNDLFLRKYDKTGANTYAEAWTSQWGTAEDDKLPRGGFALDDYSTGYINANTNEVWPDETYSGGQAYLMLKVSVGDFNNDGLVNWDDMAIVMDAVDEEPLVGVCAYDFDSNGDSDGDDVTYFMEEIFDSKFGDFDYDGAIDQDDYDLLDGVLGVGWKPGDTEVPITHDELIALGWRGFTGPDSALIIGTEEWEYLYAAVPEPSTLLLMGLGCLGFLAFRRRRR